MKMWSVVWQVRLFLILWATALVNGACDLNWVEKDGSCIRVVNSMMTWPNGQAHCGNMHQGAHLIWLKDRTMNFLQGLPDFQQRNEYHVGATNSLLGFQWGDGTLVSISIDLSALLGNNYALIKGWETPLKLYPKNAQHDSNIICEYSSSADGSSSLLSSSSSSSSLLSPSSSMQPSASSPSSSSSSLSSSLSPSSSPSSFSSLQPTQLSLSPPSSSTSSQLSPTLQASPSSSSSSLTLSSASTPKITLLLSSSSSVQVPPQSSSSSSFSSSSSLHHVIPSSLPIHHRPVPTSLVTIPAGKGQALVSGYIDDLSKLNITDTSSLEASINLTQTLLEMMEKITSLDQNPLFVSKKLEEFALRFAGYHLNNTEIMKTTKNMVVMVSNLRNTSQDFVFIVPEERTSKQPTKVVIPSEDMSGKDTSIVVLYFNNLRSLMQKYKPHASKTIQSNVLVVAMIPGKQPLNKNVTLGFKVKQSRNDSDQCSFWNFTSREPGWSGDGCTVAMATNQYVECSCNHLTHFAVLMQIDDDDKLPPDHDFALTILTYIGLTLSILGCILTFFTYWALTDVRSEQTQIRMNLVAFLAIAHALFLMNSLAQEYMFSCVAVAVLTQFLYTAALCWMCAEGILLYQHIVKVFNTDLNMKYVYCFAWGIPTLLIVCSLSIAGNDSTGLSSLVNDNFCWLSVKNNLIWIFIVPVFGLILFNLVILGMVVKELSRINRPNCESTLYSVKTNVKAFALLAPLLGITWITGLLCILGAGLVGAYIFTILNSTQGLFIFIFYCIRSSEIRLKVQRRIKVMDESTPPVKKISSGPPVKLLHVQYKPHSQDATQDPDHLVLSDFDKTGLNDTATKDTRLSQH